MVHKLTLDFPSKSVKLVFMRSWERKDIVDILIAHHKELSEASLKLALRGGVGDFKKSQKTDDDCIVIESFLEETFDIEWDGLKFLDAHKNTI